MKIEIVNSKKKHIKKTKRERRKEMKKIDFFQMIENEN
jgi:hypothetical protein